jgi:hypothetical protein
MTMEAISITESACKPLPASTAGTELILSALRSATLRAKLDANEFETIGIALRAGMISPKGAIEWLEDSGLVDQVFTESLNEQR